MFCGLSKAETHPFLFSVVMEATSSAPAPVDLWSNYTGAVKASSIQVTTAAIYRAQSETLDCWGVVSEAKTT